MSTVWTDLLGAEVKTYGTKYRTRVIESGTGPALILIHGVGGHAEAWSRNVIRLSERFRVLAIDLIGHGLSSKPDIPVYTVADYVVQIQDLVDAIHEDSVFIEGESLGGAVAMAFALQSPERVAGMVLNTTAGVATQLGSTPSALAAVDDMRTRGLAALADPNAETIRRRMEWLMASPERVTDEIVDIRLKLYQRPEVNSSLYRVFDAIGTSKQVVAHTAEQLKPLADIRTLVLWTEKNPGRGPDVGRQVHDMIPNSEFSVIDDAAHWPQWEKPEEHDAIVTEFLLGGRA